MITAVDPIVRLGMLKAYMNAWVDKWPQPAVSFETFCHRKYAHLIPGTIEHAKATASHCYYCGKKLRVNNRKMSTVDHYVPRSIGKTDKYVISCQQCNNYKGSMTPYEFIRRVTQAELRGQTLLGVSGGTLKHIFKQVQVITNDIALNTGPRIYFIRK